MVPPNPLFLLGQRDRQDPVSLLCSVQGAVRTAGVALAVAQPCVASVPAELRWLRRLQHPPGHLHATGLGRGHSLPHLLPEVQREWPQGGGLSPEGTISRAGHEHRDTWVGLRPVLCVPRLLVLLCWAPQSHIGSFNHVSLLPPSVGVVPISSTHGSPSPPVCSPAPSMKDGG